MAKIYLIRTHLELGRVRKRSSNEDKDSKWALTVLDIVLRVENELQKVLNRNSGRNGQDMTKSFVFRCSVEKWWEMVTRVG